MDANRKKELKILACKVRMGAVEGVYNAKSGHPGGSLSIADIMTYLYFEEMRVDPKNPKWEDRDRIVLSKGHTAPALYAAMAYKGYFPVEELKTLRKSDSRLQGHQQYVYARGPHGSDKRRGRRLFRAFRGHG